MERYEALARVLADGDDASIPAVPWDALTDDDRRDYMRMAQAADDYYRGAVDMLRRILEALDREVSLSGPVPFDPEEIRTFLAAVEGQ